MARPLMDNDRVSYIVSKPFTSRGKEYKVGDDFPQEEARNIEVFVRARFVIPVVEDISDKPRYLHREIRPRAEVMSRLKRDLVQLRMPTPPDSVDLEPLTHPELTPEPTAEPSKAGVDEEPTESGGEYDPGEHTVNEVREYLEEHPEDRDRVLEAEAQGRQRKGLLEES